MDGNVQTNERVARLERELAASQRAREALRRENAMLLRRIEQLTRELAASNNQDAHERLQLELIVLSERLARQQRDLYGTRSERRHKPEGSKDDKPKKKPRQRTETGPTPQPKLDHDVQEHLFDEADLVCPKCGHTMVIKQKTAGYSQIDVEVRRYRIKEHRAQVAGCGGCGAEEAAIYPKPWVKGSRYTSRFAIDVAHRKYGLHLPLARQEKELWRLGAKVRRNTLAGLLGLLHDFVQPTVDLIHQSLFDEPVLHADETSWRLMPGKGGSAKWWVWALASQQAVTFLIQPSRSKKAAHRLLCGFDGTLVCDGFSSYAALERLADRKGDLGLEGVSTPNFTLAGCWSHGRRGFVHAEAQSPDASLFLNDIDDLFEVESEAVEIAKRSGDDLVALRQQLRAERSQPIVDRIYLRCEEVLRLSGTALDKAIAYLVNQKKPLQRFLEDGRVPLTNNHAERLIRGPVQGRKAHQGSRSEGGARIASAFYTLIGTCGLAGVDPVEFMKVLVDRGGRTSGYALLPRDYAAELAGEGQPPQG